MNQPVKQGPWEPCPRCGAANVLMIPKWGLFSFFLVLALLNLFAGILIWILLPLGIGCLLACFVILFVPKKMYCKTCKFFWKTDKKEEVAEV